MYFVGQESCFVKGRNYSTARYWSSWAWSRKDFRRHFTDWYKTYSLSPFDTVSASLIQLWKRICHTPPPTPCKQMGGGGYTRITMSVHLFVQKSGNCNPSITYEPLLTKLYTVAVNIFQGRYSLLVEGWFGVWKVAGSIPSQGPRHTKDVQKLYQ